MGCQSTAQFPSRARHPPGCHPRVQFYFSNWGANVFLQPYLAVLWRSLGFSGAQIGVLSFIRPMVAAPSGGWHAVA